MENYIAVQKDHNGEVWDFEAGLTLNEAESFVKAWVAMGFSQSYLATDQ